MRGTLFEHTALAGAILVEADLTLAKVIESDLDGAVFTGAVLWGANFFATEVFRAHGVEQGRGWIQDASGVPRREAPAQAVDRRGTMLNALRRA